MTDHRSGTSQHTAVLSAPLLELPGDQRPVAGIVAILPEPADLFTHAVLAGGGHLTALDSQTRGIIWLSYHRSQGLADVLEANPQISWVQLPWAGVDAFAEVIRSCSRPGLLWTSAKGAYAQPVAEHTLALTLALLRVLPKRVLATSWNPVSEGRSLFGQNVVIIGAGGIALEIIRLLEPFQTRITVVRRNQTRVPGAEATVTSEHLVDALPQADVVIIAAALTGDTRHLIGKPELALMKPTSYLINIARGALIDTDALVSALENGEIAGAGIDVTDPEPLPDGHPLWTQRNCLITPHSADTPEMTEPLLAERIRHNVEAFLGHGRFVGVVDPEAGY